MAENNKSFITQNFKIGLAVIVTIGILYFGINYLKGINIFKASSYFYAQYERIDGVVKTTPVMINGYQVGHVSDIIFDYTKEAPILIEITVDKKLVVPKGTIATIYDTGLMGDKAIELKLGSGSEICQRGDTLQTDIQGGLVEQVMSSIMPQFDSLVDEINGAVKSARTFLDNEDIKTSLANIKTITNDLKKTSKKLNKLMDKDLPPIVTDVKATTEGLSKISSDISEQDLNLIISRLDSTLSNLNDFTKKLTETDNTLGLLVKDKSIYQDLDSTINSANNLLIDLKENPKRYVHFSVFGKKEKK